MIFKKLPLILTVVFIAFTKVTQGIKRFGCDFEDDSYYLSGRNSVAEIEPKFGEPMEPMKFNSESELNQFIRNLTKDYFNFFINREVNTIDPFIEFYDSFNNNNPNQEPLETFFKKYKPNFDTTIGIVGLYVGLLEHLEAYKPYMAAVKQFVPDDEKVKLKDGITNRYMTHVNIVIKVYVNESLGAYSAYKMREGFIILDIFKKPVILMTDGGPPTDNKLRISPSSEYPAFIYNFYSLWPFSVDAIVGLSRYHSSKKKSSEWYNIIYLENPYCSFVELTHRNNLLNYEQFKWVFDHNGYLSALVYFDLKKKTATLKKVTDDNDAALEQTFDIKESMKKFGQSIKESVSTEFQNFDKEILDQKILKITDIIRDQKFLKILLKMFKEIRPKDSTLKKIAKPILTALGFAII